MVEWRCVCLSFSGHRAVRSAGSRAEACESGSAWKKSSARLGGAQWQGAPFSWSGQLFFYSPQT